MKPSCQIHAFKINTGIYFKTLSQHRDVTTVKIKVRPRQWWAESASLGWNRVKVSENLGATAVTPVAPVDTSLQQLQGISDQSVKSYSAPASIDNFC